MKEVISKNDQIIYKSISFGNKTFDAVETMEKNNPIAMTVYDSDGNIVTNKEIINSIEEYILRFHMAKIG